MMRFNGAMTPYRIGWYTHSQYTRPWRRPHRPWQAESEFARFARRSLTARGAFRKITRDDAAGRAGSLTPGQRLRWWWASLPIYDWWVGGRAAAGD